MNKTFSKRQNPTEKALVQAKNLTTEIASRRAVSVWLSIYDELPNPDPVLRRTSNRIDILDEIKREPHVAACTKIRKAGASNRLWKIEKANATPGAAELAEKVFANLKTRQMIREMLDGWGYGYKPLEVLWRQEGSLWLPFEVSGKSPSYFEFGVDNELRLKKKNGINSEPVPDYKFLLSRFEASYDNPYGEAQYSLSFWPTTFKKGGIKQWAIFLESFGMPHPVGHMPRNASTTDRNALLEALENLVRNAAAVIPDDATVELLEANSGSGTSDCFERNARYHDGEISKVILGHSAAADATPGRLGNENNAMDVRNEIVDDDAWMVMECCNDLIRYIHEINPVLGENRPEFVLYAEEDVDTARADRDFKLMNSGRVILTKQYFMKRYDYDEGDIEVVETLPVAQPSAPMPPAQFSAPSDSSPAQTEVDALLASITDATLQEQMQAIVQPLIDALNDAESFAEASKLLPALGSKMNVTPMQNSLEKAMLLSHIAGNQPEEATA
jgi:phage gp29-like protein